jgi:hypothetical protein
MPLGFSDQTFWAWRRYSGHKGVFAVAVLVPNVFPRRALAGVFGPLCVVRGAIKRCDDLALS